MIKVCVEFVRFFPLSLSLALKVKNVIFLFISHAFASIDSFFKLDQINPTTAPTNTIAENYRLQSKYENHLIAKVALFQFVNSFLSLFYIAFYLRDQDKLKEQLAGKKRDFQNT